MGVSCDRRAPGGPTAGMRPGDMPHPPFCFPAVIQPWPLVLCAIYGPFPLSMLRERPTRDVRVRIRARVEYREAHEHRDDERARDGERSVVEQEPAAVVAVGAKRLVLRFERLAFYPC